MQCPPWILGNAVLKGPQYNASEGRLVELWTTLPSIPFTTEEREDFSQAILERSGPFAGGSQAI